MSEKKNIDRLFQERFKDFEVEPPQDAWANIEARLHEKKRRRIIPFWFQLSGVAAALILGWLIYNSVTEDNSQGIVNQEETITPDAGLPTVPNSLDKNEAVAGQENSNEQESSATGDSQTIPINSNGTINNRSDGSPRQSGTVQERNRIVESGDAHPRRHTRTEKENAIANRSGNIKSSGKTANSSSERNATANKSTINQNELTNPSGTSELILGKGQQVAGSDNKTQTMPQHEGNNKADTNRATDIKDRELTPENEIIVAENETAIENLDTTAIATVVPNTLEELLNEKENNVTTEEQKVNRWQLSSNVAPIYFSSTSNGSPIDPEFSENNKEFKQNMTYGLGVRYAINKKLSVRTGVNSIAMEYNTNDVVIYQNSNARPLKNVESNLQGSVLQVENKRPSGSPIELTPNSNPLQKFDATINQRTGYIEIPVELSYKLLDKKLGIDLIGGVSTLLLSENEISVMSSGTEMEIGKATNLNSTHFSTNLGIGVRYNIYKSFQLNFEPMFKYQINTFSDSGNFKPYFFGLYTGINYRF
ncbi:MAG: outer membrane beta-barrel protein [Flavobacterium sp.]|nr:outer membrane beta-barrel protein [Flavobacterium sp.]